jgi:hypothetical protein
MAVSRRAFLVSTPLTTLMQVPALVGVSSAPSQPAAPSAIPSTFPTHDPALAREMVGVSHGNVARVRELLSSRPALANASWDWGYGDWESALGAASHVGNREIAGLLLAAGAPPTIFSATMLGQLETVKAIIAASPGVQKTRGPHGITLLSHAKAGGPASAAVMTYLESLGDADPAYPRAPLTDADRTAIVGAYAFGTGPLDRLVVAASGGGLSILRPEGVARGLVHLGERVFHPVGGAAVRIKFASGD